MNKFDDTTSAPEREVQINALLDGELGKTDTEELKAAAQDDRELARAIVEAYQLQQALDTLEVERAPASLRKRLRRIPREQRRAAGTAWLQPRWAMALATVPLVLIAVSLMQPQTPTSDEIAQARRDMAIAFAYLDKAGVRTGREIETRVGDTMADAITGSVIHTIKSQSPPFQEQEA